MKREAPVCGTNLSRCTFTPKSHSLDTPCAAPSRTLPHPAPAPRAPPPPGPPPQCWPRCPTDSCAWRRARGRSRWGRRVGLGRDICVCGDVCVCGMLLCVCGMLLCVPGGRCKCECECRLCVCAAHVYMCLCVCQASCLLSLSVTARAHLTPPAPSCVGMCMCVYLTQGRLPARDVWRMAPDCESDEQFL